MITILDEVDGEPVRLAVTYNGIILNDPDDIYEDPQQLPDAYRLDAYASQTAIDYVKENREFEPGVEVYNVHKLGRVHVLRGGILAPSFAVLNDKVRDLAAACDPDTIAWENADPFLALDFSCATEDTANWPTGYVPSRYYVVPINMAEPALVPSAQGLSARLQLTLLSKDPRRYAQTASTKVGAGTATNIGDYRSPLTLSIAISGGSGSATYTITNSTSGTSLVLDLSGDSSGTILVDMDARTITKAGATRMDCYVSGDYFPLEPGNNTVTYSNTTHTTSTLTWRHAWSL